MNVIKKFKQDKKFRTLVYVALGLFVLYQFGAGTQPQAVMKLKDLNDKGYEFCGGPNLQCCEENTYYVTDSSFGNAVVQKVKEAWGSVANDYKAPSQCCSELSTTDMTIYYEEGLIEKILDLPSKIWGAISHPIDTIVGWIKGLFGKPTGSHLQAVLCEDIPFEIPGSDWLKDEFNLTGKAAFYAAAGIAAIIALFAISMIL